MALKWEAGMLDTFEMISGPSKVPWLQQSQWWLASFGQQNPGLYPKITPKTSQCLCQSSKTAFRRRASHKRKSWCFLYCILGQIRQEGSGEKNRSLPVRQIFASGLACAPVSEVCWWWTSVLQTPDTPGTVHMPSFAQDLWQLWMPISTETLLWSVHPPLDPHLLPTRFCTHPLPMACR